MSRHAWGDEETKFFYELTPEKILDACESTGLECTGRVLALNSMENRVYEVEIETDEKPKTPSDRFRIVKFYRPGRWSREQIQEEHQFLQDLVKAEIPAVAPLALEDGSTIGEVADAGIWYTIFPKVGGRSPDELTDDQVAWVGRLLGRMHAVGASRTAERRITLDPQTYGIDNLKYLTDHNILPAEIKSRYIAAVEAICTASDPWFRAAKMQRIHGDCHLGNLLWASSGPFWVDFDDMVRGPVVQDLWLMIRGRDEDAQRQLEILVSNYETMAPFQRETLRLIEPLRALRFVHFNAWIAKRWSDPAFPRVFGHFGTERYWMEQLHDLESQRGLILGQV